MLARRIACTLVAWAATVSAQPERSALPSEVVQALPGAALQGQMRFRLWGFDVYDARLWTLPGFSSQGFERQHLALELRYLRGVDADLIAERSLQELRRQATPTPEQAQRWLAEMQRIFPDVKAGDRISGQHLPGQGARFWHNGRLLGQVDDPSFARLFFGIWLAPTTSEPGMRVALLGLAPGNTGR